MSQDFESVYSEFLRIYDRIKDLKSLHSLLKDNRFNQLTVSMVIDDLESQLDNIEDQFHKVDELLGEYAFELEFNND